MPEKWWQMIANQPTKQQTNQQSIEDGKIPTQKVKVNLSNRKMLSFDSDFHFFGRDFAILNT